MRNRKQRRDKRLKLEKLSKDEARQERKRINKQMTVHHLLCKSRTELFKNLDNSKNKVSLRHSMHNGRHCMYGNKVLHEILSIEAELHKTVLEDRAYEILMLLSSMDIYKKEFVK